MTEPNITYTYKDRIDPHMLLPTKVLGVVDWTEDTVLVLITSQFPGAARQNVDISLPKSELPSLIRALQELV